MCAQKMKIYLKYNCIPYHVSSPHTIPLRFQDLAQLEIAKHIASGVITPCDESTDWCSPAFFVPKGNGNRVRLVTDYTKLNKFVVRPVHSFSSVADLIQSIHATSTCFAKLDATHGYFQLLLDDEAQSLTTFILPSGCYCYLRAPMGLSSSLDEWWRHSDRVVWCKKIVDDTLIWAASPAELEERLHAVLQRCQQLHVILPAANSKSQPS